MLHICDQVVFLPQEALGNGKLHGVPGGDILVRRLWAGGNLTASLKKDFTARSKNRGSGNKPWGDVSFKGKHARGRDGASVWGVPQPRAWRAPKAQDQIWGNGGANSTNRFLFWTNVLIPLEDPSWAVFLLSHEHVHTICCIKSQNEIIVRPGDTLVSCSVRQSLPDQQIIKQLWNTFHLTASFKVFLCNPKMCFVWHSYMYRYIAH